jgi:hypothetical protein
MHLVLVATTTIVAAKLLIVDMDHTAVVMAIMASVSQDKEEARAGSNLLAVTLARRLTGTNPLHPLLRAVGTSRLEVVTAFGKGVPSCLWSFLVVGHVFLCVDDIVERADLTWVEYWYLLKR